MKKSGQKRWKGEVGEEQDKLQGSIPVYEPLFCISPLPTQDGLTPPPCHLTPRTEKLHLPGVLKCLQAGTRWRQKDQLGVYGHNREREGAEGGGRNG